MRLLTIAVLVTLEIAVEQLWRARRLSCLLNVAYASQSLRESSLEKEFDHEHSGSTEVWRASRLQVWVLYSTGLHMHAKDIFSRDECFVCVQSTWIRRALLSIATILSVAVVSAAQSERARRISARTNWTETVN
jgi:hypothetical protein